MSLAKSFSGRKRNSSAWNYFEYSASNSSTTCNVADPKTGSTCGSKLAGKNPSNLKKHLQACHPIAFQEMQQKDMDKTAEKVKCMPLPASSSSGSQTITECITRRPVSCEASSNEHQRRESSLISFVVDTGYPVTVVDNVKFREFCSSMDSKFKIPGLVFML